MAAKMNFHKGDKVITADGKMLGTVNSVHDTCINIKGSGHKNYWLPRDVVRTSVAGVTLLKVEDSHLKDAAISSQNHKGLHTHDEGGGGGMKGMMTSPLFLLISATVFTMKDKDRREKVMSLAKSVKEKLPARMSSAAHTATEKLPGRMSNAAHDATDKLDSTWNSHSSPGGQGTGGGTASGIGTGDLDAMKPPASVGKDPVDEASWESFPASDPPGKY